MNQQLNTHNKSFSNLFVEIQTFHRFVITVDYTKLSGPQLLSIPVTQLKPGNYFVCVSDGSASTQRMIAVE